jgi:pimeloyl-ACP methyl ester carboxylesterase
MLGYSASTGSGRVAAGEWDTIWTPRTPRRGTCGVVLVHGSGAPRAFIDPTAQPSSVKMAAALATVGIPCVAGDFGGQAWGNDTVVSRIDAAWAVLKAQFPSMRTDKVCLLGGSMGGAAVAHYSQMHPTKVAAVVGLIPLWNLTAFYAANPGSVATEVGAAWGVTAPAALPAAADIAGRASLAAGIPTLAGYSSSDTTVLPTWVTAYAAAVGGTAINLGTNGHSDATIGQMSLSTLTQFLTAHGA